MASGWRIIDCSNMNGRISSTRGAISIQPTGKEAVRVPVEDIAVLLIGHDVELSGGALHRCMSSEISVMLCDWRGIPEGAAFGWSNHSRIAARRLAQAHLSEPRRKSAWKAVIKEKIWGQAESLKQLDRSGSDFLLSLRKQVRSGDPENIEGQAARYYWKHLFGEDFVRTPGTRSGINGLLDYTYTILRGHGIRAVLSAGLEPSLGIFHHNRANPFCLVDDLMEPFRPFIDAMVAKECIVGEPELADLRPRLVEIAGDKFTSEGHSIPASFEDFAQHFGMYVEGNVDSLLVPRWSS